jgi:hypothetical protein
MKAISTAASRYGEIRRIQVIMAIGGLAYHTAPATRRLAGPARGA